jgi:hypothetical protein
MLVLSAIFETTNKMKILIYSGFLLFSVNCFAQKTFSVDNASKNYNVILTVDTCDNINCQGMGTIKIFAKKTKLLFQTLT